jgi:hypothetical protein
MKRHAPRRGTAAVELAVVSLFVLVPTLICVWEIGRLIHVKQIVSTSAREGARLAGQGFVIGHTGAMLEVRSSTGSLNVKNAVYEALVAAGLKSLQKSDVTVEFLYLAPRSDGLPAVEPYQGEKGQPFSVKVTIPWEKVRWVNLGIIRPSTISFTATWRMLVDEPFSVNDQLPNW